MPVTVAPGVFIFDPVAYQSNEHVMITAAQDPRAAGRALGRAAERFMRVTADGEELSPESLKAVHGKVYTPSYVSDVRYTDKGPWIYVDCQSEIPPAMKSTLISILLQELDQEGVTSAHLMVPGGEEIYPTS